MGVGLVTEDTRKKGSHKMTSKGILGGGFGSGEMDYDPTFVSGSAKGRWPANIIFDEEAGAMLDEQSGPCKTGDLNGQPRVENKIYGKCGSTLGKARHYKSDAATGASRFFYCAKASSRERNEGLEELPMKDPEFTCRLSNDGLHGNHNPRSKNNHPTVKPLKLMEYLIKLVMPPKGGLLLDPFAGSGTTILAAKRLGFEAIGIEKSSEYCEIARKRIELKPMGY